MHKFFIVILFLFNVFLLKAQDEEETKDKKFCQDITNKKAIANYQKGIDKKKYKKPERMEFLKKAMDTEPDFAEVYVAFGLELVARCKLENKPFTITVAYFKKALSLCPQVHSEPYYYIGFDYYEQQKNDSAIKYLEKFILFQSDDEKKFGKEYGGQLYQAKMMVKTAKKENALKKNVPFNPRVVHGVSTQRDEYLAYISPDDKNCYFVRRLPVKSRNQVFESDQDREVFMIAKRDNTGQFNSGEPMKPPFNTTDDNQGSCSISIDNKHLYFAISRDEGGAQSNCDIYVCDDIDGEWSDIKKLSPNVNHPKYWDSQPTIASDGLTLYFVSDRPGGYGGIDIWLTKKDPVTGQWGVPQNLGPSINTSGDEKTPFIHSDSETLYFSSNGHLGFGGYDIYYSRKDEKGEWTEAENIGSPINGESDDTGFFVSSDAKTGYFFSYDEGKVQGRGVGRFDLYSFELYKEARPQQISFVKGNIKDKEGNAVSGAVVELKDMKTKETSYATVDSTSGEYMAAVKKKHDVLVTIKKDSIAFNSQIISTDKLPATIDTLREMNIEVAKAKAGSSFIINNLLYTTNSAELMPESRIILEGFADYLKTNATIKIEIQGHTDNVGNLKDNEALSSNRAYTVKAVLEQLGIDGKRITAKGFGANKPIADNDTETGRAKNRRTEFLIVEK
ncbi:MAG: OmpA family protein [Bacteroidetes bacterium]|nr:OmpA family protein [Bacteroidota bacterium]